MCRSFVVLLLLVITLTTAKAKDNSTACDGTAPIVNGTAGELKINGNVPENKTCEWIIDGSNVKDNLNIHLSFVENLVLADNDVLNITTENNDTVLYSAKGFQWPGVILLGKNKPKIRVKLILTNDKLTRNWDVHYSTNVNSVQIQDIESTGKFVFPYNKDVDIPSNDFSITLKSKFNNKKLLLNLETLELNGATVTFSKVAKYNNTPFDGKIIPDFLLSSEQQINIKISNLKKIDSKSKGLQLHYDLVDSVCSEYVNLNLTDLDKDKIVFDVILPNNQQLASLSSYRCLNIFEHKSPDAKLLLDLSHFKFINTGDLITILDGNSRDNNTLAVIESTFLDIYWKNMYLYSSTNKLWVMFESPQVINRNYADDNKFGVQSLSQGGSFVFNTTLKNETNISINSKSTPPLLLFTFLTDSDKQIVIDFDNKKSLEGKAGKELMQIFETNSRGGQPILKLNSGEYPPDIMASNTNELKISFSQTVDLNSLNITSVSKGCHSTYTGTSGASFSSNGCSDLCSWVIPRNDNTNGTFVLQFSHLNLVEATDELKIEMLGTTTSTVLNLKGPLTTSFPDMMLTANETYVLYAIRKCGKDSVDGSHLVGVSLVFVDHNLTTHEEPVEVDKTIALETYNYPNYYSVGSDHLWNIGSNTTKALLTFTDINLSPGHQLFLRAEKFSQSLNSTPEDMLVPIPLFLRLNSDLIDIKQQPFSGRGFTANLTTVNCGDKLTVDSSKPLDITTPANLTGISKCIWLVSTANPNNTAISILDFTVTLDGKEQKELESTNLRVWDSNSLRDNITLKFDYFKNETKKSSSTNSIIIEYTIDDKKIPLKMTFTTTVCKEKCINTKRCILPEFYCNGFNDCGDYSDERCNGSKPIPPPPTPEPAPVVYHSGVNGWLVFLFICPLMIGIGVLGTLFGPRLLTRVGRGRYREFQDFSEVS